MLVLSLLLALRPEGWVVLAQQASQLAMEMLASVVTTSVVTTSGETALDL